MRLLRIGFSGFLGSIGILAASPTIISGPWSAEIPGFPPSGEVVNESLHAVYSFGWGGIEAGTMDLRIDIRGTRFHARASGGTTGTIRGLWKIDATYESEGDARTLRTSRLRRVEHYRKATIHTEALFNNKTIARRRWKTPPENPNPPVREFELQGAADPVAVGLLLRRHLPSPGQSIALIAWPGESPYLVRARNEGSALLEIGDRRLESTLLAVEISEIGLRKAERGRLLPHPLFRKARVWIDPLPPHLPYRAEIDLFIGSIFVQRIVPDFSCFQTGF